MKSITNTTETEVTAFHFKNCLANQQLHVTCKGMILHHNTEAQYMGVTVDRTLTFKPHMEKLKAKVRKTVNII